MAEIVILGGGISGLAASYFLKEKGPVLFEKNSSIGGHCRTHYFSGCFFDEGPHLIFTKHAEVLDLFDSGCTLQKIDARIGNYWSGCYVDHPVIDNLCQLPKQISDRVWKDYCEVNNASNHQSFEDFRLWCNHAYGKYYTENFVRKYTKKYWQVELEQMSTDWMGPRLPIPNLETVKSGLVKANKIKNHYISKFNYPKTGGFQSIFGGLMNGADINLGFEVHKIDLKSRTVYFKNGNHQNFDILVNTLPINEFISYCDAPEPIEFAANSLKCTSVNLVNIVGKRKLRANYNWLYVYDLKMLSTRVTFVETLSSHNVKDGSVALQVEVYDLQHSPLDEKEIKQIVCKEALENGWIDEVEDVMIQRVKYANVISTNDRKTHLDKILNWLSQWGLTREDNDLDMVDDWNKCQNPNIGNIINVGRFAQWKYFWTDDCVLRAKDISKRLLNGA